MGDDTVDVAAGLLRGLGDNPHQPRRAPAINEVKAVLPQQVAEGRGMFGVNWIIAHAR